MTAPCRTLGLGLTLALLYLLAGAAPEALVFSRERVLAGEYWRLVSGHLVHSGPAHLGWNLAALLVVGSLLEQRIGARWWAALAAGMAAIDGLLLCWPALDAYCGLSGVLNTLLAVLLLDHLREPVARPWALATLLGMTVKIGVELHQGAALLTHTAWPAFAPAHLAGLLGALPVVTRQGWIAVFNGHQPLRIGPNISPDR